MTLGLLVPIALAVGAASAAAQDGSLKFHYPPPEPGRVEVSRDVPYGALRMDVYGPRGVERPLPVLIFFNIASGAQRSQPFYKAWAEIAAAHEFAAVLPDLGAETFAKDFDALVAHLTTNAGALKLDRERIAVYAGSGNVFRALPLVQDPQQTAIKSAVMYYGTAPVATFRGDLPLLFVRAGLDRPPLNRDIDLLVSAAAKQNAPVTLLNYPGGHHAFEIVDDGEGTRDAIDRTLAFVKATTSPDYQTALRRGLAEASAAALVSMGRFKEAAQAFGELTTSRPEDARLRLSYGEALLGAGEYGRACAELDKLKGKGLGPRDLGLPAARACMQQGNADTAIAWLQSIPPRFLPREIAKDPIFAPIQDRPEFRALFQRVP